MRQITFNRLETASFTHSAVYTALLICAFVLGNPQPATFILGLSHGLIWIAMSLICLAAARAGDPVLARRDGGGSGGPRAVRGVDRIRPGVATQSPE